MGMLCGLIVVAATLFSSSTLCGRCTIVVVFIEVRFAMMKRVLVFIASA